MDLAQGDVLNLDFPVEKLLNLMVNGKLKFRGTMVNYGRKRAFQIDKVHQPLD